MGFNEFSKAILDGTEEVPEEADEFAKLLIQHEKRRESNRIRNRVGYQGPSARMAKSERANSERHLRSTFWALHGSRTGCATRNSRHTTGTTTVRSGVFTRTMEEGHRGHAPETAGELQRRKDESNIAIRSSLQPVVMWYAEARDLLAQEQYGSRKKLAAIDHCLNKRLTFDLIRQNKQPGILCSNDAKGCYDRIVHSVASICLQRLGMPEGPLRSMFETLQNLEHYVRSSYDVSERTFNACDVNEVAIQGIGQGNRAGPQIWAAVSTVLLNALRSTGAGGTFQAAISGDEAKFVGYAFVDDTDLVIAGPEFETSGSTAAAMQEALRIWEGCLRASGGAIEPSKTFWYGINFEWQDGNWSYQERSDDNLTVRGPSRNEETLEQVGVDEARRTLGVRLAPHGNDAEQAKFMVETITAKYRAHTHGNLFEQRYGQN
jgi:Reverse transcriptase (RNA-dependent DNA polymerase)